MILRLTKQFGFEMAHALPAYEGKCHNIHGHSYKLFVTVEGAPLQQQGAPTDGMVLDFHQLKEIVSRCVVEPFDHALVLPRQGQSDGEDNDDNQNPSEEQSYSYSQSQLPSQTALQTQFGPYAAKILLVDFQPTTENLLMHFAHLLEGELPAGTRLHSLRLFETESSCAELVL